MTKEMLTGIVKDQLELYPEMQITDILKAVYQSVLGCGHFVSDTDVCRKLLYDEISRALPEYRQAEKLGRYCRIHLSSLDSLGITADQLLRMFILSASKEDRKEYFEALTVLPTLCEEGIIPFPANDMKTCISKHRSEGAPPFSHSGHFHSRYSPAYRVIKSNIADIIPIFAKINELSKEKKNIIIALDGDCASGKSTLGELIQKITLCDLIHMDDYFLPPEKKTAERLAQPGGNVDYERFSEEVLIPLSKAKNYISRPYRCHGGYYEEKRVIIPAGITLVEGSYSLHPELECHYDLKLFLSVDPDTQKNRIAERNPSLLDRFTNEWIPYEKNYFEKTEILKRCDIHLSSKMNFEIEIR